MADLVLINPPLAPSARYGEFAGVGNELPNLGLVYLAAFARGKGYAVRIIDAPAQGLGQEDVVEIVNAERPLIAGFTAVTIAVANAANCASFIKKSNPEVVTVIGGAHVSSLPVQTLEEFPSFDVGVTGEGENTLAEMLDAVRSDSTLNEIPGLVLRRDKQILISGKRELIKDLDTLPMPAWDLLPDLASTYRPSPQSTFRLPSTIMFTTRGCPFKCSFCDRSVFGGKVRPHSAQRVLAMMKHLHTQFGIVDFAFHDESFIFKKSRLVEFCELVIESRLPFSWICQGRVDQPLDPEILGLMQRAGCRQLQFGVETANDEILEIMCKGTTVTQVSKALENTKRAGISTKAFFMVGLFGETERTLENTERFMLDSPLDDVMITFFTPFPGSDAYEQAGNYGRIIGDYRKMSEYEVVFVPHGLTAETLTAARKRMYRRFYFRPRIIANYFARLKYPSVWKMMAGSAFSTIKALKD